MAQIAPRSPVSKCNRNIGAARVQAAEARASLLASVGAGTLERRQVNLSAAIHLPDEKECVEIVRRFIESGVRFVLVGALAEMHAGATPVLTAQDGDRRGRTADIGEAAPSAKPMLELCYADSVANARRLAAVLRAFNARPQIPGESDRETFVAGNTSAVDLVTIRSATALAFATPYGTIHVRREVAGIGGFGAALQRSTLVRSYERELTVLDLSALAEARTASGTCGDIARLPVLETLIALPALEARRREIAHRRTEHLAASPSTHVLSCPKTPRRPPSPSSGSTHGSPPP
jgi:hypothetical protein